MSSATAPCVIDVEASGFGRGSYPIEVGYVRHDGRGWCSLVSPAEDWQHWDTQAQCVHGIARELLERHGRSPADVARQLNQDLDGLTVYTDAWGNDMPWLHKLHDVAGVPLRYRVAPVAQLLDDRRLPDLGALRQQAFQTLGITRHRASSDARALQWALGQLLN
jgi:hypothetical protein